MRIAVVSDIHGNRTAFEAVLADLRETAPDLIFHGGDLADSGSCPAEVVDRIRDLGWPGVQGNTDDMLVTPESLNGAGPLFDTIREMAQHTREQLGEARLAWIAKLPRLQRQGSVALVHASPETAWRAPAHDAPDQDFIAVYAQLKAEVAVYAHVHRPFVRQLPALTVANTGSVSLPYDGDPRASYLLLDGARPTTRRVEYDVPRERKLLAASRLPHANWIGKMLTNAAFSMPC